MRDREDAQGRRMARLAVLLLGLRLLTWAFLLPPWSGFDEPYQHGLVETYAEDPRWHSFMSVGLPPRLVERMRDWPLYRGYADSFAARTYGEARAPDRPPAHPPNYETLQSPAYYWMAGLLLRIVPRLEPIGELFFLRGMNALLALAVGLLALGAARVAGYGSRSAYPVLLLAFIPGYALALVRVSNDAACATLISIAVFVSLRARTSLRRRSWTAALAAGLSPWAKLYGWTAVPKLAWDEIWRRPWTRRSVGVLALLFVPGLALGLLMWRFNGHPVSILENLNHPASVRLIDVPWLNDGWMMIKTQIWMSGMSDIVFPTPVYVVIAAALAFLFWEAVRSNSRLPHDDWLWDLIVPILCFAAALAYFAYRNFALSGGPGGAGGWYLWSMAVAESLILTRAAARDVRVAGIFRATLAALWLILIAGDLILFVEPSGRLIVSGPTHHFHGIRLAPIATLASWFMSSRPPWCAILAVALALSSWVAAAVCLWRLSADTRRPRGAKIGSWTPSSPPPSTT